MGEMILTVVGAVAGTLTTISSIPQLIKSYRSKSTLDLCLAQMLLLFVGLVLWMVYGALKADYILVATNGFSVLISVILICLKLKYDRG